MAVPRRSTSPKAIIRKLDTFQERTAGQLATSMDLSSSIQTDSGSPQPSLKDPSLTQQLHRVLHLLTVTALVLGFFLTVAVLGALWAYHRHRSGEPHA